MVRIKRKTRQALYIAVPLLLLLWIAFVPLQLGGWVSYVIISGNSMEPEIQKGDLVVTRKSVSYQLDQRVVYDHPQLGYVFHRIVDQAEDRFILQGDNNNWLDSYHPEQGEILGKFWYSIPGAGKIILGVRQPVLFTLFAFIIASFIVGLTVMPDPGLTKRRKRRRKRMSQDHKSSSWEDFRLEILLVLTGIAVVALIIGLIAFSKDPSITVKDDLIYTHKGDLNYSADVPRNIYDNPQAETGDPIYPALTCLVDLDFTYQFSSPRITEGDRGKFAGTISLWAEIRDNDGWHRTIPLLPEAEISSFEVSALHTLDICQILELIREKETQTGVMLNSYALTIIPRIKVEGEVAGQAVEDEFQPEYPFNLSDAVLRVPNSSEGFTLEKEDFISQSFQANNLMNILGKQFTVIGVRWTAFAIFGICLLAGIYPAWSLFREWNASERSRIELQHRPVMIDLKGSQIRKEKYTVIDLETMADLRKLADRYGAMIMHEMEGPIHRYLIVDEGFLYQFETDEYTLSGNSAESGKETGVDV